MAIKAKLFAGTALALTFCMAMGGCASNVHKVGGLGAKELDLTGYALTFEDNFDGTASTPSTGAIPMQRRACVRAATGSMMP